MRSTNRLTGFASLASLAALAPFAALVATGCAREVGTADVTSAPVRTSPTDSAAMRVADELCGRATACREIGSGGKYRTEEACQSEQGVKVPVEMKQKWSCTPSQTALDTCLAAIRGETCETQLSQLDVLGACKSSAVCGQ